jgi:hypothetical protein
MSNEDRIKQPATDQRSRGRQYFAWQRFGFKFTARDLGPDDPAR